MNSISPIPWYFDPISPFAWLAWNRLRAEGLINQIEPRPLLFAGLLDHYGSLGPAEIPGKRRFTYRMVQWRAEQQGVALRFPPAHPFNPLAALRLVVAAGSTHAAVGTTLQFVWGQGRDPSQPVEIAALAQVLGITDPEAALSDPEVKQRLRSNFDAAQQAGVFGVPTAVLDGELYWGDDAIPMLRQALESPSRFQEEPYARLHELPTGIQRKASVS